MQTNENAQTADNTQSGDAQSILLINDMPGYGKVALSVMIPVLSHMQLTVYNLPTALVSNTLDYGTFDILETTDYMKNSLKVWDKLGFEFDAIATGFMVSEEQSLLISEYCKQRSKEGVPIFVDPIMGDNGALYNGVTQKSVGFMRNMCSVANIIMPNMTEAQFLTGKYEGATCLTMQQAQEIVQDLHDMGSKIVVITSMNIDDVTATLISDSTSGSDQVELLPYDKLPISMPGTGDLFSAVLVGNYLHGATIQDSVSRAMNTVVGALLRCKDTEDICRGIPIELHLDLLEH